MKSKKNYWKQNNDLKPNLLIYAHYYYPDVASTGQILKELSEGISVDFNVYLICVIPSYEGTVIPKYKKKKYYFEELNGVKIIRVRVPEFNKSNKISRIQNIIVYFLRSIFATLKVEKIDFVYAISQPPILGGLLGVIGKYIKHAKYIYNIQDFNPEQILVTGYFKSQLLLNFMLSLDKFSCLSADKVIVVGRDMVDTLNQRFPKKMPPYALINNWVNEQEVYPLYQDNPYVEAFKRKYSLNNKYIIMYSGNLGLYYDLENLMPILEKFPLNTTTSDGRNVVFVFVGTGSIKNKLVSYKMKHNMDNVIFIPYQDKEELIYSLNAGDVHLVTNAKGIKGISCPSKLYGICSSGKPVLGILEENTEARLIIEESHCGLVCTPGDYEGIEKTIKKYISKISMETQHNMGNSGRKYLVKNLSKNISIAEYVQEIKGC